MEESKGRCAHKRRCRDEGRGGQGQMERGNGKEENRHERVGKEERGSIKRMGERRLAVWF